MDGDCGRHQRALPGQTGRQATLGRSPGCRCRVARQVNLDSAEEVKNFLASFFEVISVFFARIILSWKTIRDWLQFNLVQYHLSLFIPTEPDYLCLTVNKTWTLINLGILLKW